MVARPRKNRNRLTIAPTHDKLNHRKVWRDFLQKVKQFLARKDIEISFKRYGLDVLGMMAYGLFASLLVGTILNTIGTQFGFTFLSEQVWPIANQATGAAIAVAIAHALKAPPLVMFASTVCGLAGYQLGGPVGTLIATLFGVEAGKMISKETVLDIVLTPTVTILVGTVVAVWIGPGISRFLTWVGEMVIYFTTLQPFLMGILVSVVMGMILTLPISSAALSMMLGLSGLAGGAATAGCCANMVGFAVISFRENRWGGLLAQGLGTSMLQVPNIMLNWRIWIPVILASAITGPISTMVFQLENTPLGSGMGTSGLVGQLTMIASMSEAGAPMSKVYLGILLVHFILPAVLSLLFDAVLRKIGWIRPGDMKLQNV